MFIVFSNILYVNNNIKLFLTYTSNISIFIAFHHKLRYFPTEKEPHSQAMPANETQYFNSI